MNSAVLTLFILVLATHYQTCASRYYETWTSKYNFFGKPNSFNKGLCADSITTQGYECHEFEVVTNDGYILSIQRIPVGRSQISQNATVKEPVIIQHGIMMDGSSWFMNKPNQNLPMILADNGFDVWITNARGTKYSRKHTFLEPSNENYWNWSWDELVSDEMPAIFDFVFNKTGQKINYLGHSLGTLVALVSLSEGKWINQVKSVALLSPIAYLRNMKTAVGVMSANYVIGKKFTPRDITEFDPKGQRVLDFVNGICDHSGLNCNDLFTAITGENCCLDEAAFVEFLKVEPQSTSKKMMFHLARTFLSDSLTKFDYGRGLINMKHYGQQNPPAYNLSNIPNNIPFFMSYGGRDALSDVVDVKKLLNIHFQNHEAGKLNVQFIQEYAHADYMMAVNANELVYKNVSSFFKQKF
ncbi:triacylglycerol lipase 2-like [Vicia villosa]|uniref:triacylglycerol lipase 2-like n=1 Tax=Vicia villosa TaxID=3911 RepID=UPI00273C1D19|nr:triacylglycerol lipase 2-like [Vicia villosa]